MIIVKQLCVNFPSKIGQCQNKFCRWLRLAPLVYLIGGCLSTDIDLLLVPVGIVIKKHVL